MVCCGLSIGLLSFLLIAGWEWHWGLSRQTDELQKLAIAEDNAAEMTRLRYSRVTDAFSKAAEEEAAMKLADLVTQTDVMVFPEPQPLLQPISSDRQRDALLTMEKFLQATTWEQKLQYVSDPERVKPLMQDYYEVLRRQDPPMSSTRRESAFRLHDTEVLLYSHTSSGPGGTADLAMTARNSGEFKVDWESFVGASEMSWPDFKKQRSAQPKLFRVFAQPDEYYNYEFSDAGKYLCFNLTSPDGLYFIYGFCEKESAVAQALSSHLASGPLRRALTLRLAFPSQAQSDHCVRITGIVANRWLLVP